MGNTTKEYVSILSQKTRDREHNWRESFCMFNIVLIIYCCSINYPKTQRLKSKYLSSYSYCCTGIWVWLSWVSLSRGLSWAYSQAVSCGRVLIWSFNWVRLGGEYLPLSSLMWLLVNLSPLPLGISIGLPHDMTAGFLYGKRFKREHPRWKPQFFIT